VRRTPEDRAKRETANQSEYEQCKNEADATLRETSDANFKRMPMFLATVLGLIVIAWLIELLVVEIARLDGVCRVPGALDVKPQLLGRLWRREFAGIGFDRTPNKAR